MEIVGSETDIASYSELVHPSALTCLRGLQDSPAICSFQELLGRSISTLCKPLGGRL